MRKLSQSILPTSSRSLLRSCALVLVAVSVTACSSGGNSRFASNPFSNPFEGKSDGARNAGSSRQIAQNTGWRAPRADMETTSSIRGSAARVDQARSSVSSYAQPMPPKPDQMARLSPWGKSNKLTSNANIASYAPTQNISQNLSSVRPDPVVGKNAGWTAVGGSPVTLRDGEDLTTLSNRYGVPVSALMAVNGLSSSNQARAGQQLIIPAYNSVNGGTSRTSAVTNPVSSKVSSVAKKALKVNDSDDDDDDDDDEKPNLQKSATNALTGGKSSLKSTAIGMVAQKVAPKNALAAKASKLIANDDDDEDEVSSLKKKFGSKTAGNAPNGFQIGASKPESSLQGIAMGAAKAKAKPKAEPAAEEDDDEEVTVKPKAKPVAKAPLKITEKPKAVAKAPAKEPAPKKQQIAKAKVKQVAHEPKIAKAPVKQPTKQVQIAKATPKPAIKAIAAPAVQEADPETTASINKDQIVETDLNKAVDGTFRWPVRGRIISGFGPQGAGQNNEGINIAVPEGTPVKSTEAGTVAYTGSELKGYGNLVLIRHENGYVSAYAHNSEILVKRGDKIERGQVVARSGQSGNVTSPQVHFELRKNATPVDPTKLLD